MPPTVVRRLTDLPGFGSPENAVALTFDDGPHPRWTPQILDILRARGVRATFFVTGLNASRHPDLVRRIAEEGHALGTHTWNHRALPGLSERKLERQVDRTVELVTKLAGRPVPLFRPPRGRLDAEVLERLAARELITVLWSVDPRDWSRPPPEVIASRVLEDLKGGDIVILHDGRANRSRTAEAVARILDGIRARGTEPVQFARLSLGLRASSGLSL